MFILFNYILLVVSVLYMVSPGIADQMLPESGATRYNHHSASETCRQTIGLTTVRPPGCAPKTVLVASCRGTCHSRNIPEWRYSDQEIKMVNHCTCCKPHVRRFRFINFRCPNRPRGKLRWRLVAAFECGCRPCAEGNPQAEQPYDY